MNKKLLDILACPICKHHPLEAFNVTEKDGLIIEGALYCTECSRYFPIIEEIPIMLPDELRDKKQDIEFLKNNTESLPEKIVKNGKPWHVWEKLTSNFISDKAKIGNNVKIWHFTYVGDNTEIGAWTIIHAGVVVYRKVSIGTNNIIHAKAEVRIHR